MDITLKDYLEQAETYHDLIDKTAITIDVKKLNSIILTLQKNIRTIQGVAKKLADVSNLACRLSHDKAPEKKKEIKTIQTHPTSKDYAVLKTLCKESKQEIVPNISVPAKIVGETACIAVPTERVNEFGE